MATIKERLIQVVLRGKDMLSGEAARSAAALDALRQKGEALQAALGEAEGAAKLATQLDQTRTSVDRATGAYSKAQDDIARLRRELDAAPDSKGLQTSLRESERYARTAGRELDRLRDAERELEQQARQAGVATDALGAEQDRLQGEVAKAKRALDDNAAALDELRRKQAAAAAGAAEHASRVGAAREAMSGGMRTVLAYAAAYVSLDAALGLASRGVELLRGGIGKMLQTGDQFEALQARMTSLMGSVQAGEQATQWIADFAKTTPLALTEAADAFMQLKAFGLDPMDGTLKALVDKNEQLGGGMDRLTGIVTAFGQAQAKGKLQTEEILQLVERGVPAWDLLAKVTGKNSEKLQKLASDGKLGRDVIKALIAELGKSADGAAEAGMSRLSGLLSNLGDTATDFYNRIARAGALDYVKGKLQGLLDTLGQMDRDGRLDRLAKSLSDAFMQGGEKVEAFARKLAGTDFNKLIDDSSTWLKSFGQHIDDVATRVQLFTAPFRTLFNGVTAGFATLTLSFSGFLEAAVAGLQQVAKTVPDMMGGEALRQNLADFRTGIEALQQGLVAQIEQDGQDIRNAWDTTGHHLTAASQDAADAQSAAAASAKDAWQQAAEAGIVSNDEMRAAIVKAAIDGKQAITGMAGALELIDTATTVQQLEGLRDALRKAYQDGELSQQEYAQSSGLLNTRLAELQKTAAGAADGVSNLEEKLGDLKAVQAAIATAKTDVDIDNIRTALRKLYNDGSITAAQYNQELQNVSARQKELKGAIDQTASAGQQAGEQLTKSQQSYNQALEDGILTNEELRRVSGQRMEEERRASGEAMERQRKGLDTTQRDMSAMEGFFGGVMSRARAPLAAMSAAALSAYDRLRGITSVDLSIDTSSLDATSDSLRRVSAELDNIKAAQASVGMSGFGKWQLETQRSSLEVQKAYLGQKGSLQSLMAEYERGGMGLESFIGAAEGLHSTLGLLNESDLSSLESAIASAQQRMQSLADASRSTLENLQSELDQLRGNQDAVDERRFAQRRRDLQAQIEEARANGNNQAVADLTRALSILREVQTETAQQRTNKDQQARQQQAAAPPAQAPQPTTVIRLESAARGARVDVSVAQGQQTQLLDILSEAGLRTV